MVEARRWGLLQSSVLSCKFFRAARLDDWMLIEVKIRLQGRNDLQSSQL